MQQLITSLHHLHTQYPSLPVYLFLIALIVVVASTYNQKPQGRYIGYGAAAFLLLCFVFVL